MGNPNGSFIWYELMTPDAAAAKRAALLKSRAALHAEEAGRRYDDLSAQLETGVSGSLDQAFVSAYDEAEARLGRGEAA